MIASKKQLPKNIRAYLKVIEGPDRGQNTKIMYDKTSLGRRRADIIFTDPKISGTHCLIEYRPNGKFYLIDQKSMNGTFVNNTEITEVCISDGNIVSIGGTMCIFSCTVIKEGDTRHVFEEATKARSESTQRAGIREVIRDEFRELKTQKASFEELKAITRSKEGTLKISIALEVVAGADRGKRFEITKGSVFVGRLDTDIVIRDTDVSRRHLLLETFGRDQIFIRDLASTNGTYVNDKKIVNTKIRPEDIITIGNTKLKLLLREK